MSTQRLIKGRVAEAVNALQGACASFDRSINSSFQEESQLVDENDAGGTPKRQKIESPKDTVRLLKEEIIQLKTKLVALEADKEMQAPLFERDAIEKENKLRQLNGRLQASLRDKEAAEVAQKKLEDELRDEKVSSLNRQTKLEREIQLLRSRLDDLDKQRLKMNETIDQDAALELSRRTADEKQIFELKRQLIESRTALGEAQAKLQLLEESRQVNASQNEQLLNDNERLTDELNRLKTTIAEYHWAADLLEQAKELDAKMKIMPQWETELITLRKENEKLKSDRSNVSLLREKLMILDNVKQSANKARQRCAELESDLNLSQQLCSEWESCLVEVDASLDSPQAVIKRLRKLQDSELFLVEENSKLKTELDLLRNGQRLENEDTRNIKRLERKLKLVTQERDSYKSVLDSYESDVTVNPSSMNTKRIAQLEATLDEYRKLTADLEANGCQKSKEMCTTAVQTEEAGPTEAGSTSTVESDCRLIHFINNPLDIAHRERIERFKEIEKENDRLRAKVKALEEHGSAGETVGDVTVSGLIKDDPRKLRAEIEVAKKRQERIMAAFKKTSKEFRQAVYCLTGYRMDMTANRCVLRHVYAESPDDQLEFEIGENGYLHLLGNNYSLRLEDLTRDYLQRMDSIPAFLAALTLRLFNSQTFMQMEQPSMFVAD